MPYSETCGGYASHAFTDGLRPSRPLQQVGQESAVFGMGRAFSLRGWRRSWSVPLSAPEPVLCCVPAFGR